MNDKQAALICVPVCVSRASEILTAVEQAARVADIIELRLDCLADENVFASLRKLLIECGEEIRQAVQKKPLILTFRPREQGGRRDITVVEREKFWRAAAEFLGIATPHASSRSAPSDETQELLFADIELDLLAALSRDATIERDWNWERIICSHHDFKGVPPNLEEIYEALARTPARILKLAVRAHDITDCIPVFRLLERARRDGRKLIAIAMGEAGLPTRILAPSRGAFLTYGALATAQATAPGQISAAKLRGLYRIESINSETFITGLAGSPVSHSLSPHIHNAAFAAHSLNGVFIFFEVKDVRAFVRRMAHPQTRELEWNLRGFSVTAPHKTEVLKELDDIEPTAREIGAVNTVVIEGDRLVGYNTDAQAALVPLQARLVLKDARVAVIGAGGAARALLWGLSQSGARVTIFARNAERAHQAAKDFGAVVATLDGARFDGFDVVINATPLGTRGESESMTPANAAQLRGARIVYDLVYNPAETRLLREARAAGCETIGGLTMLVGQASEQFRLWTGLAASQEVMRSAAERVLQERG